MVRAYLTHITVAPSRPGLPVALDSAVNLFVVLISTVLSQLC